MLAKVNIAEFTDLALCCPASQAMLAIGDFGIGKTQIITKIGEMLGLEVIVFDCTHLDNAGDILGLPSIINGKTVFNPTYWYEPDKPVLLFFDEVFRANAEVRAALMTLCLEQKIADKKLAPGSRVFAAANPPGYHGYEGEIPDPAQLSRYAAYWLRPSFDEFMEHAKLCKIHQSIIDFLADNKGDLDPFRASEDMNVEEANDGSELVILQSRRSYFKLSDNLYQAEKVKNVAKLDKKMVINIASGYIGPTLAVKFAPYYVNAQTATLTAESVLKDWDSVKPSAPLDVATATKIANDIKITVIEAKQNDKKIPAKWKKNYGKFIREGMSKEAQVAIINNMVYTAMTNDEDWVFDISDDDIQSFYEETIANKVA